MSRNYATIGMVGKPMPHPEMGSDPTDQTTAATIGEFANSISGQLQDAHGIIDRIESRLNGPTPVGGKEAAGGPSGIMDTLASDQNGAGYLLKRLHELESRIGG